MMMMMERWAEKAIPQTHIFTPSVACLGAIYRLPLLYPAPSHIVFPFHSRKARMRVLLGVRVKSGSLMGALHTFGHKSTSLLLFQWCSSEKSTFHNYLPFGQMTFRYTLIPARIYGGSKCRQRTNFGRVNSISIYQMLQQFL